MFSKIFVERPKLAMVISIIMAFGGLLCMTRIPVAEYPEIAPPSIQVTATYPGASSEEIAESVAAPIEAEVNGVEDMIYFSSESNNNGSYSLSISFKSGTDTDIAQVNVQNAVRRAENKLPSEVRNYGINIRKRSNDILTVYTFQPDPKKTNMSMLELGNFIRMNVRDELARIDGISEASIMGASDYSMRIWLDPMRMSSIGISPAEVAAAISEQNVQAAAGSVGVENSNNLIQMKVNAFGRLKKASDFENITVRTTPDGRMVKLKDIARVELGAESYAWDSKSNGKDMIVLAIYRNSDANAINVVDAADAKLKELYETLPFPEGISYFKGYDPTKYIRSSMKEIAWTLLLTLVLVVGITWLFLQSWRATLIPALTIPVSILSTFIFLYFLGFSMNLLTMFALILVIGSLVDDAIVVVENVMRILQEEHLSPKEATIKSMNQITGAIIATTLVIVAIYAPIGFYGGMVGTIYVQFSVTMCIALCISTFNAMTLSPALCALLLKETKPPKFDWFGWFNVTLNASKSVYLWCSSLMVRRAIITVILFVAVIAGNYYLFKGMHSSFLPLEDKGALLVAIELPPGASLARTRKATEEFYQRIKDVEGVKEVIIVNGFSFLGGQGENLGLGIVSLKDWEFRTTPETQIDSIRDKVTQLSSTIPSARIIVMQPPAIMGLGTSNDVTFMLQARAGQNASELETATFMLMGILNNPKDSPNIAMAYSQYNASTAQLYLDVDREKAKVLQIPVSRIFSTLQSKLASVYINDFNLNGFSFKVLVQAESDERAAISDIEHINILSDSGKMIPITSFAKLSYKVGPRVVTRFNQLASANFMVKGKPGVSSGEVMQKILDTVQNNLKGFKVEWVDMSYQERGNEGKLVVLMSLALLFAYLFLVGQYESWTMPLSVILSVAIATLGALIGLKFMNMSLSIYAQLGLIMLIGLSGKNAILMAEFSKQAREEGQSVYDAAQNGGGVRYRAVLMTAWSFVIGVFPMVVATGAGAGSRQAIGITTFSGMVLASIVGIVFVPPLWALFQRMSEFISPEKKKMIPSETNSSEK